MKKFFAKFLFFCVFVLSASFFYAEETEEVEEISLEEEIDIQNPIMNIGVLRGMTSLPFAFMYDDNTVEKKYDFAFFSTPLDLFRQMKDGNIDAAIISAESAEKLTEKSDGQVFISSVITTMNYKIISKHSRNMILSGLAGSKVYVSGDGQAKHLLTFLLEKNSIPVKENSGGVEIVQVENQAELVRSFLSGKAEYVMAGEPCVQDILTRSRAARVVINLKEQYEAVCGYGKTVPETVLVIRTKMNEDYPKTVQDFTRDLENSIERLKKKKANAAEIAIKNDFGISRKLCIRAIDGTDYDFYKLLNF